MIFTLYYVEDRVGSTNVLQSKLVLQIQRKITLLSLISKLAATHGTLALLCQS